MKKMYQHALSIFTSHVYKRSRISGFCNMYQHVLWIFTFHVSKSSKVS